MRHLVGHANHYVQAASNFFIYFLQGAFAFCAIVLITLLASNLAHARNAYIFDVKRNIPMSEYEPIYKDYYINAGTADGLKTNLVFDVIRYVSLKDLTSQGQGEALTVPVGQLKVLFAQDTVAVARLVRLYSREDLPILDQVGIMVGDRISLKDSFVDKKSKRKIAGMEPDLTQDSMQKIMPIMEVTEEASIDPSAMAPQSLVTPIPAATTVQNLNTADPNLIQASKETSAANANANVIEVPVQVLNPGNQAPVAQSELTPAEPAKTE
ncbi:MAG: hypothetical protein AB7O96_02725 [Pseudobdellovibrionaceae bacterium]